MRVLFRVRGFANGRKMLDTEKDSPAELVYPRLGYVRVSGVM